MPTKSKLTICIGKSTTWLINWKLRRLEEVEEQQKRRRLHLRLLQSPHRRRHRPLMRRHRHRLPVVVEVRLRPRLLPEAVLLVHLRRQVLP